MKRLHFDGVFFSVSMEGFVCFLHLAHDKHVKLTKLNFWSLCCCSRRAAVVQGQVTSWCTHFLPSFCCWLKIWWWWWTNEPVRNLISKQIWRASSRLGLCWHPAAAVVVFTDLTAGKQLPRVARAIIVSRIYQKAFINHHSNVTQIHKCFKTCLAQFGVCLNSLNSAVINKWPQREGKKGVNIATGKIEILS